MDDLGGERVSGRRKRADAVRNRAQILRAAVETILEFGNAVPMDVIARRAGVGAATLYRHFPDRANLYRQVLLYVQSRSVDEAEAALREEKDAFAALARYMHKVIDLRGSAVTPLLRDRVPEDEHLVAARNRVRDAVDLLVTRAHRERALRPEVSTKDIAMLTIRVCCPIPGMSAAQNLELSHRHLELLLDGFVHFLAADPSPAVNGQGPAPDPP